MSSSDEGPHFTLMGVDISVWRCRIGTFNASIHRSSGKRSRVKKSLTLPGGNGVPVVILAAAVLLLHVLVVAGEVQHHKHSRSTSLLSVPFCAGGSALAHRFRDAVTPAVAVSSMAIGKHTRGGRGFMAVTAVNFDQLSWRGRYATLQPVAPSIRETHSELMNVTMPCCVADYYYTYISTLGFHETTEPFCQHSSFHLSILNTHHLQFPPPHFSSSPLLATLVSTSATDTTTTADHHSAHTIALTAGSSYALTIQSSFSTAQGECVSFAIHAFLNKQPSGL